MFEINHDDSPLDVLDKLHSEIYALYKVQTLGIVQIAHKIYLTDVTFTSNETLNETSN